MVKSLYGPPAKKKIEIFIANQRNSNNNKGLKVLRAVVKELKWDLY
jgi:hypothetical protein